MLAFLVVASVAVAPMDVPASAPASGPAFEIEVGRAIKQNYERLGAFEVEYTRTDEDLLDGETLPSGEVTVKQRPQPIPSARGLRTCYWKEDPASMSVSYLENRGDGISHEMKYDGDNYYRRISPTDVEAEAETLPQPLDEPGREERLAHRERKLEDCLNPLYLMFPKGYCPLNLGLNRVVWERPSAEPSFRSGQESTTRFVRSSNEGVEAGGGKLVQFDREIGSWTGKTSGVFRRNRVLDRWWLDPAQGYLPVRIETYSDGAISGVSEVLEYRKVGPNTWFPVKGRILTMFLPLGKFKDNRDLYNHRFKDAVPGHRVTLEVTQVACGKVFGKDEFKPSPGAVIHRKDPKTPR